MLCDAIIGNGQQKQLQFIECRMVSLPGHRERRYGSGCLIDLGHSYEGVPDGAQHHRHKKAMREISHAFYNCSKKAELGFSG